MKYGSMAQNRNRTEHDGVVCVYTDKTGNKMQNANENENEYERDSKVAR